MIEVKPSSNAKNYGFEEKNTTLELTENGTALGAISISTDSMQHILYIHALCCEDKVLADFLVRSAAAYGDNRYCLEIVCLDKENDNIYSALGFSQKDQKLTLPVSNIVHKTLN
ncbi:MAG: hypothetical protein IJL87_02885 [Clostridia bacterium]|nr:hypothetical protein [Clostridia bacterium]